ncbi:MAG: hypothetical protein J6B41_05990 [Alistipes sp.]|nr:hypothetical protein [Alistipes sp.]
MIKCYECGCPYNETLRACPECGAPNKQQSVARGITNCPNCGAPVGNQITCDYCESLLPKPEPQKQVIINNNNNNNQGGGSSASAGATIGAAFLGGLIGGLFDD